MGEKDCQIVRKFMPIKEGNLLEPDYGYVKNHSSLYSM